MKISHLDHVSLHVSDLETSIRFYEVLGLKQIPRPDFDFPGAWFGIGTSQQLHLITGLDYQVNSGSRATHIAVGVDSISEAEKLVEAREIPHKPAKKRPDGYWQLFVIDPDGYYIELNSKVY